jgi:hypothetical protein
MRQLHVSELILYCRPWALSFLLLEMLLLFVFYLANVGGTVYNRLVLFPQPASSSLFSSTPYMHPCTHAHAQTMVLSSKQRTMDDGRGSHRTHERTEPKPKRVVVVVQLRKPDLNCMTEVRINISSYFSVRNCRTCLMILHSAFRVGFKERLRFLEDWL